MAIRSKARVANRAAVRQKAQALDEIAMAMARYLASDGRVHSDELIAAIARTIEMKTDYIFLDRLVETDLPAFKMTAYQRIV